MSALESLKTNDDKHFGVEVIHKDGNNDWYDPLTEDSISENETEYIFNTGIYTYNEPKRNVAELRRYALCQICLYPIEHCHCPDTEEASR